MLTLITHPNDILRTKGEKIVDPLAPEIQELIPQMIETMHAEKGVGLAAQQIGRALQLTVMEVEGITYVLMNPKITATSREMEPMEEGCLSFPDKFIFVKRFTSVQIRFTDIQGEKQKLRARGLLAHAIQHEIDHVNGILMIDRV